MKQVINLAGVDYDIQPLSLGQLKKVVPAFGRVGKAFFTGDIGDAVMDDIIVIIAGARNISKEEAEAIPAEMNELIVALEVIANVCGLCPDESNKGELVPVEGSTGTSFTAG